MDSHYISLEKAVEAQVAAGLDEIDTTVLTAGLRLIQRHQELTRVLKEENAELDYLASHDALTGLLNKRGLEDGIARYAEAASPQSTALVVYVDIDKFKNVNDTYGHVTGDHAIIEVANRLVQLVRRDDPLRKGDMVGRIGGDEFLVIMPLHYEGEQDPWTLQEKTSRRINDGLQVSSIDGEPVIFGASVGVALLPARQLAAQSLDASKHIADKNMYANKQQRAELTTD